MGRLKFIIFLSALFCGVLSFFVYKPIKKGMESYALSCLYESHGNMSLSSAIESSVDAIVKKMDLSEEVSICKMNVNLMRRLGYHNACACYPSLLCGFIIFNKPHFFISEGFFEDLSIEEQNFIIGHELAHIREHHLLYLPILILLVTLMFLIFWWFVVRRYIRKLASKFDIKYYKKIAYTLLVISFCCCLFLSDLIELAYRRHIERYADSKALHMIKCHEGALKVIDRWSKESGVPLNNDYYGIFCDHPSSAERIEYCLKCR